MVRKAGVVGLDSLGGHRGNREEGLEGMGKENAHETQIQVTSKTQGVLNGAEDGFPHLCLSS